MLQITDDAAYDIYNLIVGVDAKFIKQLAKAAIVTAVEIQTDMFRDADPEAHPPNDSDVTNHAADFATDMIHDFKQELIKAIKEVKFTGNIKVVQTVESNLKFE